MLPKTITEKEPFRDLLETVLNKENYTETPTGKSLTVAFKNPGKARYARIRLYALFRALEVESSIERPQITLSGGILKFSFPDNAPSWEIVKEKRRKGK